MDAIQFSLSNIADSLPAVDWEQGLARVRGNRALFMELLLLFFKQNREASLRSAAESGCYEAVAFEAHGLKGTAANLGLRRISQCAAEIENVLRLGEVSLLLSYVERLDMLVAQARREADV